jgi:hypothetical protein
MCDFAMLSSTGNFKDLTQETLPVITKKLRALKALSFNPLKERSSFRLIL